MAPLVNSIWIIFIINITSTHSLTIECNSTNLCSTGSITCDSYSICSIKCHGDNICKGLHVTCPTGPFDCKINCNGQQSCRYATIDASKTTSGDLTIQGRGKEAFSNMLVTCPMAGNCIFKSFGTYNSLFSNIIINATNTYGIFVYMLYSVVVVLYKM